MVRGLPIDISDQLNQLGLCADCMRNYMQQRMPDPIVARTFFGKVSQGISQTCSNTAEKVTNFLSNHKEEIFFIGCSAATAFFAPQLFFPAAIITVILRVEINYYLSSYAKEYLKDDHNPYLLNPRYGPQYVSSLALSMGTIAAIDAIALGTLYIAGSFTIAMLPVLGGIAAGSVVAKVGMDIAHALG